MYYFFQPLDKQLDHPKYSGQERCAIEHESMFRHGLCANSTDGAKRMYECKRTYGAISRIRLAEEYQSIRNKQAGEQQQMFLSRMFI